MNYIMTRKIGAFEVLVAAIVWMALFGTRLELFVAIAMCGAFWWSRRRFGGEFSLRDIKNRWSNQTGETTK